MKTKLTLLLVIISVNITFAQWVQVGYMVGGAADTATSCHSFKHFGGDVYCGTNKGLYRTSDDGTTWQSLTYSSSVVTALNVNAVAVVTNGDVYTGTNYRLYKSVNNGASWAWVSTFPDSVIINDIIQIGSNIVVSYGNFTTGGIYYSANNGTSWNAATGLPNHRMMHFLADGSMLYVGGYLGVYSSADNGQTWMLPGTGFSATSCSIFDVVKSGNAFFAGDVTGNGLYGSFDNCATWNRMDTISFIPFCQVFSVVEANNRIVTSMDGACNPGGASPIKMSNDTANSWSTFMGGLPQSYFSVLGRNTAGTAFFTFNGNGKEVYRTGLTVGIPALKKENVSVEVYPNPATNLLTVTTNNSEQSTIIIYDLLSRKLMEEAFTNAVTLNIESLSKGIYMYEVKGKKEVLKNGKLIIGN